MPEATDGVRWIWAALLFALWLVLISRDAWRVQNLWAFWLKRREPLALVSMAGSILSGAALTMFAAAVYVAYFGPQASGGLPPLAGKLVVIGAGALIIGWGLRLWAWMEFKRRYQRR